MFTKFVQSTRALASSLPKDLFRKSRHLAHNIHSETQHQSGMRELLLVPQQVDVIAAMAFGL